MALNIFLQKREFDYNRTECDLNAVKMSYNSVCQKTRTTPPLEPIQSKKF